MGVISFEKAKVYNFEGAIRNMRNSWESWDKSDSFKCVTAITDVNVEGYVLGEADKKLALKLSKAGSDHAKYLRQIMISVDVIAGNEWWKEADTYKVGTTANSTSMMHKLGSRLLTTDDFSFDDGSRQKVQKLVELLNEFIIDWWDSGKKVGNAQWRDMQKAMSMGFIYKRGFTANYQVLKNMYHSRRLHRLEEWRDFADWVETIPYSELITLKSDKS